MQKLGNSRDLSECGPSLSFLLEAMPPEALGLRAMQIPHALKPAFPLFISIAT